MSVRTERLRLQQGLARRGPGWGKAKRLTHGGLQAWAGRGTRRIDGYEGGERMIGVGLWWCGLIPGWDGLLAVGHAQAVTG